MITWSASSEERRNSGADILGSVRIRSSKVRSIFSVGAGAGLLSSTMAYDADGEPISGVRGVPIGRRARGRGGETRSRSERSPQCSHLLRSRRLAGYSGMASRLVGHHVHVALRGDGRDLRENRGDNLRPSPGPTTADAVSLWQTTATPTSGGLLEHCLQHGPSGPGDGARLPHASRRCHWWDGPP
jgi:hypothetical protein